MHPKIRLDKLLQKRGLFESREKAVKAIDSRSILVEGMSTYKPASLVCSDVKVEIRGTDSYVSRGGIKLEQALKDFAIIPQGWIALDIGASTGGFTECLLRQGVRKVFAVDVGLGQLHYKLRIDQRVDVLEGINFRYAKKDLISVPVDIITIDVSFISLNLIFPIAEQFLDENGIIIALFKPQFEVGPKEVRRGIAKNKDAIINSLLTLKRTIESKGYRILNISPSVIKGSKGNQEYFLLIKRRTDLTNSIEESYFHEVIFT
ncbi:MAG: 16S/23S rRNA (cytidine-2'-O)-methyltransferase TlyA [candidate division WS2 bacterium]|nr:16S/23S rRNA (cytidine-2'-O)-methyltransferase TlyA [Candidatus Lithacetigena glycinireducens]MBT9174788.1 16S/23S rRNA (cytidine-2'-O)-methyltransferase TlyA [Candidatus Lithacetigena glycinireducens]